MPRFDTSHLFVRPFSSLRRPFRSAAIAVLVLSGASGVRAQTADIFPSQTIDLTDVVCGSTVRYTLSVTNDGPDSATGVTMTNDLPDCVAFAGFVSITQGSATQIAGVINTNFGTINAGATASLVFDVTVPDGCTPSYENVISAATTTNDPNPDNNISTLETLVGCGDLTVEKLGPADGVCGDTVNYLLIIRQAAPGAAGDVVVIDDLPDCLTGVSCLSSQGTCTVGAGNVITAELGTLNADASATVAISGTLGAACAPSIDNSAEVSTPAPEPDPTNNTSATITTNVICEIGACCRPDAPCDQQSQTNCEAVGGTFQGVLTDCADFDGDNDGICDAFDNCPNDPNANQADADADGLGDVCDGCPNDPDKAAPGLCGCGVADDDSDADGLADCFDLCPNDPAKIDPGLCGCGVADADSDNDRILDCFDNCPDDANPDQADADGDNIGDACDEAAGQPNPCGDCGAGMLPASMLMLPFMLRGRRRR